MIAIIIKGRKEVIPIAIIYTILTMLCVFFMASGSDESHNYLLLILILISAWIAGVCFLLKELFVVYTIDEKGITEKVFSKSRTFQWQECKYIMRTSIQGSLSRTTTQAIICSKCALPPDLSAQKIPTYHWPKQDTMRILNADDRIYNDFLSWCGGERDIRN